MWTRIQTIWFKELTDSLRDRKALRQAILMPVVIGIFYALLNPLLDAGMRSRAETQALETLTVTTIGSSNVDDTLATQLAGADIKLVEWSGTRVELETLIESGDEKLALIVPDGFGTAIVGGESAEIEQLVNTGGSIFEIDTDTRRLNSVINGYSQQLVAARLAERGIDPSLLTPININTTALTTPEQAAGQQAGFMLPILIAVVVAQGGMFVAIDVTAGEKERGTLESLLLTPASNAEIFFGKLLAVFTTTLIPLVLTFLAYGLVTNFLPESLTNGARLPFSVISGSIIVALPLAAAVNIVLMTVAVRVRTFKDAQTAVTPVLLFTMFPAMAAGFFPAENPLMAMIPAYGTGLVANKFTVSGNFPVALFLFSVLGCAIAFAVTAFIGLRLFERERLLYSA